MKKKIIGLLGQIGSGKGVARDYLVDKYGYEEITMGDLVREETKKRGLELTRDNLDIVTKDVTDKYGDDFWSKRVVEIIKNSDKEKFVIDGVRRPLEIDTITKNFPDAAKFVLVDVDSKIRFERMKKRARPGFPETYEEFLKHSERQDKLFNVNESFKRVNYTLDNNGTLEDLHKQIDELLKKIGYE